MGKFLIVAGLVLLVIGMLVQAGLPLGRLPGDIVVRRGNFTFYLPIATSVLLSVLLTVVLTLLRR